MKQREVRIIGFLLVSLVFAIISFIFDKQIMIFIEQIRNLYLDYVFLSLFLASNVFIIFFLLSSIFLFKREQRKYMFSLILVVLSSTAISYIIKSIIQRARPFQEGIISVFYPLFYFMRDNFNTWNSSFPSFHAMIMFSVLPIINKGFRKYNYLWLIFAVLVSFSRIYFGVHYLSDIIAGAAIGYFIGYIAVLIEERYKTGERLRNKFKL